MALTSIAGTNCWTQAEDKLASTLATCATVQAFLGAADEAEARDGNMYIDTIGEAPDGEEYDVTTWLAKFPHVLIATPGDETSALRLTHEASGPSYGASGALEVQFASRPDLTDLLQDQERKFKNAVGGILEEMTSKLLLDKSALIVEAYGRNVEEDHEQLGEIQTCLVQVPWGVVEEE